jgi:hypothetical protein
MTKMKHPKTRGERLAIKAKKAKMHSNASPVYKLLKEKELLDAEGSGLSRDRTDA